MSLGLGAVRALRRRLQANPAMQHDLDEQGFAARSPALAASGALATPTPTPTPTPTRSARRLVVRAGSHRIDVLNVLGVALLSASLVLGVAQLIGLALPSVPGFGARAAAALAAEIAAVPASPAPTQPPPARATA